MNGCERLCGYSLKRWCLCGVGFGRIYAVRDWNQPDGLVDAYFERGIDQMTMLAHAFRADFHIKMLEEQFKFDETFSILEQTYAKGKGV
ncbi:MAG: hypothetical protein ACYSUH_09095, partial [Planctomycetota bacterium]